MKTHSWPQSPALLRMTDGEKRSLRTLSREGSGVENVKDLACYSLCSNMVFKGTYLGILHVLRLDQMWIRERECWERRVCFKSSLSAKQFCGVSLLSNDAYDKLKITCLVLLNVQANLKNLWFSQYRLSQWWVLCKAIVNMIIRFADTDVNHLLQSDSEWAWKLYRTDFQFFILFSKLNFWKSAELISSQNGFLPESISSLVDCK